MCILFLAINQHPQYPLLICANRDEFYQRPTQQAHFWRSDPSILAGKDQQAGGSWLGVNKQKYFAAITNIRTGDRPSEEKRSRGELVTLALSQNSPINFQWLKKHSDAYNPFNLVYGDLEDLVCYCSTNKTQISLKDGFHAVSNGMLDDVWPKMAKGEQQLEALVKSSEKIDSERLFSILKNREQASSHLLPKTGVPDEWEQLLSSIFIKSRDYGTRSSCVMMLSESRSLEFFEQSYNKNALAAGFQHFVL